MKKLLISILIGLLLILSAFLIIQGIGLGNFKILGITGIKNKSEELNQKIQEAGKLAEKDYKQAVSDVETNAKKLATEKQSYEELTSNVDGETQSTGQIQKYEIETLWVKLGNHATSEGAIMKMDVITSGTAQGVYNLKFTVTGSYISITDFISDIENDSTLGFKIEEFKMTPSGGSGELQATFTCKEISIKDVSQNTVPTPTTEENNTTNTNTTNSTNNTNTTNTNTTNNTNTNTTNNTTNNTNNTNNSTSTNNTTKQTNNTAQ